jgi:hypothetical protein
VVQSHSSRLKAPSLSVPANDPANNPPNNPHQETPPLAPLLRHKQAQRLWLSLYFPQLFLDLVLADQKKIRKTLHSYQNDPRGGSVLKFSAFFPNYFWIFQNIVTFSKVLRFENEGYFCTLRPILHTFGTFHFFEKVRQIFGIFHSNILK